MKNRKHVFILIVVLLCIFVPLTIIGYVNSKGTHLFEDNPSHEFYYDGALWFYDEDDNYLNKYECNTTTCSYATSTIDDEDYGINYYKNGTKNTTSLIASRYALINDGANTYLFDTSNGTIVTFKAVKTYNHTLQDNLYIMQNESGIWGVISINESGWVATIKFEYDFIGLIDNTDDDGNIVANTYIVCKDSKWYLVDSNNSALTSYINYSIIDYTDDYVVASNNGVIKIYSYEGREYLEDYNIVHYIILDDYIGVVTDNEVLIFTDLGIDAISTTEITSSDNITLNINNNSIEVLQNDNVIDTVDLS